MNFCRLAIKTRLHVLPSPSPYDPCLIALLSMGMRVSITGNPSSGFASKLDHQHLSMTVPRHMD